MTIILLLQNYTYFDNRHFVFKAYKFSRNSRIPIRIAIAEDLYNFLVNSESFRFIPSRISQLASSKRQVIARHMLVTHPLPISLDIIYLPLEEIQ